MDVLKRKVDLLTMLVLSVALALPITPEEVARQAADKINAKIEHQPQRAHQTSHMVQGGPDLSNVHIGEPMKLSQDSCCIQ